jgi:hypothetical protein
VIISAARIVRPRQTVHYLFEFDEKAMAQGIGSITVMADVDYGTPSTRTRWLHKEIEVEYTVDDNGFITRWTAKTRKDQETAIFG